MNETSFSFEQDAVSIDAASSTILVVDDTPANLSALFNRLRQAGFQVRVADDGELALAQVFWKPPDAILLDVMMPGLDGFEICRRLQADGSTREIPIIFMTALTDEASKVKGFAAGGVDYVTKPLQYREVIARLTTHLVNRRLKSALRLKIKQLEDALARVKTLEGLLPICANCKKIRDDDGYWRQIEVYVRDRLNVEFSHGLCPTCLQTLYPEFYRGEEEL